LDRGFGGWQRLDRGRGCRHGDGRDKNASQIHADERATLERVGQSGKGKGQKYKAQSSKVKAQSRKGKAQRKGKKRKAETW
jgi:hypothetical protein